MYLFVSAWLFEEERRDARTDPYPGTSNEVNPSM